MPIRKRLLGILMTLLVGVAPLAFSQTPEENTPSYLEPSSQETTVYDMHVSGIKRTDRAWMQRYLGLTFPITLNESDIKAIENKLWTTSVFTAVEVKIAPDTEKNNQPALNIKVEEKVTTVPVVRGAFGGGTPLTVLGLYDTHVFGSLWTVGGEVKKYGDSPTGGTLWARAPRWQQGYHFVSFELWQDNRIRSIYNQTNDEIGRYDSRAKMFRGQFLAPFSHTQNSRERGLWQYGVETKLRALEPTRYKAPFAPAPSLIEVNNDKSNEYFVLGKVVFDNIIETRLNLDGTRFSATAGPVFRDDKTSSSTELELFNFWLFPDDWNLGTHILVGSSTDRQLSDLYFLGGFDSIRGLPDGALVGNKAIYANLELRKMAARWRHVWLQPAIFTDAGSAAFEWSDLEHKRHASAGLGMRIAIPQVTRLMFRIDYAWSLTEPRSRGITAGMNQFFQPHKPL